MGVALSARCSLLVYLVRQLVLLKRFPQLCPTALPEGLKRIQLGLESQIRTVCDDPALHPGAVYVMCAGCSDMPPILIAALLPRHCFGRVLTN